jgi:hypothetical protein
VSSLHQIQMDLLLENDRMKAAAGDLEPLQSQSSPTSGSRPSDPSPRSGQGRARYRCTGMRDLVDQLNHAGGDMAATGSTDTRPITSEQLVTRTAQTALTRLGYGPLKADGMAGQAPAGLSKPSSAPTPSMSQVNSTLRPCSA